MISGRNLIAISFVSLMASAGLPSAALALSNLVPHRAVYNLELKDSAEKSGITSMNGRMVYEFTGSECEGYKVNFRFVTQSDVGGEKRVSDQQSTTFEDTRTGRFEFESKSYTDERLDKEVQGHAEDLKDKLTVELMEPSEKQVELQPGRFPTEHMLELIKRARGGEHFFEARVFDGSDNGDKTVYTTTVVGAPIGVLPGDPDADSAGKLKAEKTWPVTIAYFNDDEKVDGLPTYRMSFKLYENGVSRDLTMDYGDFALTGRLVKLDFLPETICQAK
ncbi:cell envelope integrity EipB family protein [Rhizobium sp. LjRoot254]|uniref:cell envelope integrity EipB family protein n=1 Tax=Rhizobium sp. LjRoot254 TaxID=3342297 RepID=UPI003F503EF1